MKYLLSVLSTCLLTSLVLGSCASSDRDTAITIGTPPEQAAETATAAKTPAETDKANDPAAEADGGKPDAKSDTEGAEQKNATLLVEDQKTVGQVIIKKLSTSRDGWVSVHQSRADGSIVLPESIGEARIDSGDSEEVVVDLWETPDEGEKLWALLHIDAGERGTYEFPEKDIPVKKSGETMARSFVIKGEEKPKAEAEEAEASEETAE
jgi:hypothetical protein